MTKTRVAILLLTALVLTVFGGIAILYAKGFRLDQNNLSIVPKGLLVANSDPNGAQVFVDGELKTATNNTITLSPGTYEVRIRKEGFTTWTKSITIEKEVVTQIDAYLTPSAPSLTAFTFSGALLPTATPDLTKIAYVIPPEKEPSSVSDESNKAGLWVVETSNLPLGFNREPRQVTDGDLADAKLEWSPDETQILLTTKTGTFLLSASDFTAQAQRVNVSSQLKDIKLKWQDDLDKRLNAKLARLPGDLKEIFQRKASDVRFSPDDKKILYVASGSAQIPEGLVKSLPGSSTQKEDRSITDSKTYIYDTKEDKNFLIADGGQGAYWLPNSNNVLLPEEDKIVVMDYDGTNPQEIYAGSYVYPFAFPSSSDSRVLFLTNLGSKNATSNLYWLSLK